MNLIKNTLAALAVIAATTGAANALNCWGTLHDVKTVIEINNIDGQMGKTMTYLYDEGYSTEEAIVILELAINRIELMNIGFTAEEADTMLLKTCKGVRN